MTITNYTHTHRVIHADILEVLLFLFLIHIILLQLPKFNVLPPKCDNSHQDIENEMREKVK